MNRFFLLILVIALSLAIPMKLFASVDQDGEVEQPSWYTYRSLPGVDESDTETKPVLDLESMEESDQSESEVSSPEIWIESPYEEPPIVGGENNWYIPQEAMRDDAVVSVPSLGHSESGGPVESEGQSGTLVTSDELNRLQHTLDLIYASVTLCMSAAAVYLICRVVWPLFNSL